MTETTFDDETLMAFADGEADEATTLLIEAAMEADDDLVARVAMFIETRASPQAALRPLLGEPVPAALTASIGQMIEDYRASKQSLEDVSSHTLSDNVTPFRRLSVSADTRHSKPWLMPVAASIAAVTLATASYLAGSRGPVPRAFEDFASLRDVGVLSALDSVESGVEPTTSSIRIVASFRDQSGTFCREFEIGTSASTNVISVACRQQGIWMTRVAVSADAASGYTPASSQEGIDAFLVSIGAGAPLSPEEERRELEKLR